MFLVLAFSLPALAQLDESTKQLAHDIFKQLIEINTSDSIGNITTASEAMAQRLREAGFPDSDIQILGPNDRKKNMVLRYHGSGKHKPVLLIGHLDVVEAHRTDWTTDPFQFVEKDGYFYGRGTQDMKDGDSIMVATLIRMKKEGYVPDRDIILALTADEEGGKSNGVDYLIKNHRDLIDAEFVLNHDAGGVITEHGAKPIVTLGASEKLYADYHLKVTNPGGHSSMPVPDNAIYHLAEGLARLAKFQFPFELNDVTRAYYERMAKVEIGQTAQDMRAILQSSPDKAAEARLSRDPIENSTMHTTCVATRLSAGHANNALPQLAEATVNCRILPGHPPEEIRQKLIEVLADPKIEVRSMSPSTGELLPGADARKAYPPVPLRPQVLHAVEKASQEIYPGAPVVPNMGTGASDGVYTNAAGLPSYGVAGDSIDRDDIRAHGQDERLKATSFYTGVDFYYRFLKALTSE